jgi:hypothetical protein
LGYRNLRTSNLREQRRQQSRLATQAPVGGSSVGHGSGLRFYDGGELIIDGLNTGLRFRVTEAGGGKSTGRLEFTYEDMTGVTRLPLIWSSSETRQLNLHGPTLFDSTAYEGFGGSHLQLGARHLYLNAGPGGQSEARLYLTDEGYVSLSGPNAELNINSDGSHSLLDENSRGYWLNSEGAAYVVGRRSRLNLNSDNSLSLTNQHGRGMNVTDGGETNIVSAGGSLNLHADGAFNLGRSGRGLIQASSNGQLNMWAPQGGTWAGDFSVSGSKNFIMDHPAKPGYTIKYGATESPVSGIEHRGRVTIGDDGTAEVVFPEHFTAIVKDGTDVDVFLQPYGPDPAWCDVPTPEGTTVHGEPGTVVAWHAQAERTGADFTVVEEGTALTQPEPQPQEAE